MTGQGSILLLHEVMETIRPMIEPEFRTVRLWEYPNLGALLAAEGDAIRVIATHGGVVIEREIVEALPNLGLIASVGVGYDGIDIAHARSRGIEVTYGAGVNSDDVADIAVALTLASACNVVSGGQFIKEGRWTENERIPRRRSLRQRPVGIVGMGMIGKAIAERLAAFRCQIRWYGPNPKSEIAWPRAESLAALARDSDILIVAAPLDATTDKLITREILDLLGPGGLLVNIGRGGLVDEEALIAALREGRLGAAALDVQAHEPPPPGYWDDVPNIIMTPHIGGFATGSLSRIGELLCENLRCFFDGKPVLFPVPQPRNQ